MLGAIGGGEQRLGAVRQVGDGGVVEDLADPGADRGAAGLPGEHGVERRREPAAWVLLPQPSAPSRAM